jgi:hypothetical protein
MSIVTTSRRRIAAVAAIAVFTVLAGASASWAYWTTQATASVTVKSADLTVTTANFTSINKTFANETLVGTGSVTVTNSTTSPSSQKGQVTLTFTGTGGAAYRGNFSFVVWLSTVANPCTDAATPGTTLASGTWGGTTTYVTPGGSGFSVGESRTYCVRTTVAPATTTWPASGAPSFTPQISAAIALGNYSGTASATGTQQAQYMFPLASPVTSTTTWYYIHRVFTAGNYCADLESGTGPNGIAWPCKSSGTANQSFRFDAVTGKAGYYTIKSNITAGTVLQQNATGTPVTSVAVVAGQANQQWMIQQTSTSYVGTATRYFYQLINASTGQCLTYVTVNGTSAANNQLQMANCDGTASQQFLIVRTMFSGVQGATDTISCSYAAGTTPTFTVAMSAASANTRYEVRIGGTAVGNGTTDASGAGSVGVLRTSVTSNSTQAYEVYEDTGATGDAGTLVATGTFTRGSSTSTTSNSCTATGMGA